ncbi:alpha/beta hydrolase [Lacticaseibacillus zeae]|nr:alpha/beta hydrolase [Lacticaseibacillus zeae]
MSYISNDEMNPEIKTIGRIIRRLPPFHNPQNFYRANWLTDHFVKGHFPKDLNVKQVFIQRPDNSKMRILIVSPVSPKPLATGVLWLHGGGYAVGLPETDLHYARKIQNISNSVVVMPDYRRSTEAPFPAALADAYLTLVWLKEHATALGVNPLQLFVGGESAGGGLTAALTLYARDQNQIKIAFQMPLYPMLDDQPTPSSLHNDAPVWDERSNVNAWKLYLGNDYGHENVSEYAAPARAKSYENLPPTYTFIGTIEPFYQETLTYIFALRKAGVKAQIDIYKGAFHSFDFFASRTQLAQAATKKWQKAFKYASNHYYSTK